MKMYSEETEERILTFMESMAPRNTPFLNQLEKEALEDAVPIIRPQTQSLLQFLMKLEKPHRILEVGTGTGFSGCLMKTYAPEDAELVTMERNPERAEKARRNFAALQAQSSGPSSEVVSRDESPDAAKVPLERSAGSIALLEGDAEELLKALEGEFDFIFMDAAKGQYINFLPDVLRHLRPGGLLLSDNIFKGGEILESRFAVKRRDRTIHRRMREYLSALTSSPDLQTLLLQEGDGAALTLKLR